MSNKLAIPSNEQLAWQDLELGMFCHFGINTFYNQEWGSGAESPRRFNPTSLDAMDWIATAKEAGFKYFILTAKHHDGFCLWQTSTTKHSVKSSPWKNGKGDVVAECAAACKELNMPFGVYLSPWDRNAPCYHDKEAYDEFYLEQLTELLTWYGPMVELWFDGAGSEGREYDWPRIMALIKKYQPQAMVFNMGAPTIRWVGNEDGVAPYPCWNTAAAARQSMFTQDMAKWLPETPMWIPAECDVPIRKQSWFWHPNDEHSLRSLDELMDIYYRSVGHGCNLLLNVAPDDRGLLPELDKQRVLEFGAEIRRRFSNPVALTKGEGYELGLELPKALLVDHVILMEEIRHGERIRKYELLAYTDTGWSLLVEGSAIGHKKMDRFPELRTDKLRLVVHDADDTPLIRRFAAFHVAQAKDE
ncbi:MAG: alpha-L-fucosidase [Limnochordia bacterium]|nr:alpha-L-fucosidase [Limnochordia bacterium]